jgi:hypothetical protein
MTRLMFAVRPAPAAYDAQRYAGPVPHEPAPHEPVPLTRTKQPVAAAPCTAQLYGGARTDTNTQTDTGLRTTMQFVQDWVVRGQSAVETDVPGPEAPSPRQDGVCVCVCVRARARARIVATASYDDAEP